MGERNFQVKDTTKKILISLGSSLVLGILVLFIGLIIGFHIHLLGYNSPYLNKLPGGVINPSDLDRELERIGWNEPLSIQFIIYIKNFFTGNWGEALLVSPGTSVIELMKRIIPGTIETMLLPMIIGLVGIKLGRIWVKKRNKIQGYIIRIFTVIGLSMPIFFLISWMQYTFYPTLEVLHRYDPSFPAPPFITGFPLFDSIFSGNWALAGDIIVHGILPTIALSFVVLALIIKQTQTNIECNSKDASFVSNSFTAGKMFGILFALVMMVEISFNITGFGYYFYLALIWGDIASVIGCIFMIIILFSFTMFFSNIIPIAYKFFRKKAHKIFKPFREKISNKFKFSKLRHETSPSISEPNIEEEKSIKTNAKIELKKYIIATLKSPFTIAGIGIIFYLAIIATFPQLLTPYSLNDITPPSFPPNIPYLPPSSDHPLGTTMYGFDILARVIYGTRDALIFGSVVTLIGLAGGSIFGFVAGRFHRYVHNAIIGSMIMLFIIPGLILLSLSGLIFRGEERVSSIMIIGILLIAIFTGIVANAIRRESNYMNAIKVIIKYIPLEMAFGIMLYQMLGYIGLADETTAQLGITFQYGRGQWGANYARFWPGFYLFLIMLGLILLHEGLNAPTAPRDILIEPVITS